MGFPGSRQAPGGGKGGILRRNIAYTCRCGNAYAGIASAAFKMPGKIMDNELEMEIDFESETGIATIKPVGKLNMEISPRLRKRLLQLRKDGINSAVVDLSSVTRIDTGGWATLVEFALHLRKNGGSVTVCGLAEDITDKLSLRQAEEVLHFCASCEEAVTEIKTTGEKSYPYFSQT